MSPKLSGAEDQWAAKRGGVIRGGETDGPRNGCTLRETRFLPPDFILAETTCCCVFCMSHQNCRNLGQTSECWLSDDKLFDVPSLLTDEVQFRAAVPVGRQRASMLQEGHQRIGL
jgi:hypothetical protein